jgi:ATP-dependent protease ClpP protease subunit
MQNSNGPIDEKRLPYAMTEKSVVSKTINIYINEGIKEAYLYTELINVLENSSSNDTIYIFINCQGGYVNTGVSILNAMDNCKARIITVLDGSACSMGSLIFLNSQEFVVHPHSELMIHNYSGGAIGKGNEMISSIKSSEKRFSKLLNDICHPFLSIEEIDRVIAGEDMWLISSEVEDRLQNVMDINLNKMKENEMEDIKFRKKELMEEIAELKGIENEIKISKLLSEKPKKPKNKEPKKAKNEKPKSKKK